MHSCYPRLSKCLHAMDTSCVAFVFFPLNDLNKELKGNALLRDNPFLELELNRKLTFYLKKYNKL